VFEELIGRLLVALGFQEVVVTGRSGDGGIDVRGTLVVGDVIRTRMAVQVKRWRGNVKAPIVQQVRGSLGTHDQGLIITTSDFSSGARAEAERVNAVPVALMNGEQLVRLLVEHEIGVRRVPYDLIEMSSESDRRELQPT
jgi:restriction system protein